MKVHVVQYTHGGIRDEPEVFALAQHALARFRRFYDEDGLTLDRDDEPVDPERLEDYGYVCDAGGEHEARWWEVVIE